MFLHSLERTRRTKTIELVCTSLERKPSSDSQLQPFKSFVIPHFVIQFIFSIQSSIAFGDSSLPLPVTDSYPLKSLFIMSADQRKAVVKIADMSEEMQLDAIAVATSAMDKFSIEKDVAAYIKKVLPSSLSLYDAISSHSFSAKLHQKQCQVVNDNMTKWLIAQEMDKKHTPTWHCIVGRNFGSYVTHETKHFAYFYIGQMACLLFKSG